MGDEQVDLCMIAHGYAFKGFCGSEGWLKPDCYRLKYKTEGVDIFDAGSGRQRVGWTSSERLQYCRVCQGQQTRSDRHF